MSEHKGQPIDCKIGPALYTEAVELNILKLAIKALRVRNTEYFGLPSSNFTIEDEGEQLIFHVKGADMAWALASMGQITLEKR